MDAREKILEAATELLAGASAADVSTRAVCEKAGVGAPMLYRLFGDKAGLLAAVVDRGFEQYLASKRAARPGEDPVADLRSGWDTHMRFALEHPHHYRLMYSPELTVPPAAAQEAHDLLHGILERCAAEGRLTVPPALATQMIMSANVGAALSALTRPEQYADAKYSQRLRDAVLDSVTRPAGTAEDAGAAREGSSVPVAAATLAARLRADLPPTFTPAESALLQQWLEKLTDR
ncbi:TetR/AcrR family transcriptional regulator [Streptomyces sp. SID13726]|uniref:TetR/AcrR family transcriptional regulator n=1 Tax=Streptomyces sp. SID13726 TaxID=2706058 RepID=UPI0013BCBC34|nr:TetR/AcrR family transcriptional regulator [Streptomyces sp. SID13726]NEB03983.1 TetR/AcrR family transcriptional regulator [Streptomyces sp. SID13726]